MNETMRAAVVDPEATDGTRLSIQAVLRPTPKANEVLIRVKAVSLNLGEVRMSLTGAAAGYRPGWDLAGEVEQAAADGSGPAVGTRVVGFVPNGSWAEQVAVPTNAVAALPDNVSFAAASTLPVAGLTALHAIERGVRLLGNRVLITGANGGVGLYALQLARLSGAEAYGLFRNARYTELVERTGAIAVIGDSGDAAAPFGPFQLIAESIGGDVFRTVVPLLAPDGVCVVYGGSATPEVGLNNVFDLARIGRASIYGLVLFNELTREPASNGLARLANLMSNGQLDPCITAEAPFSDIASVARQLFDRQIPGKAVLHLA